VPAGAQAGQLTLAPCTYDTEAGPLPSDCGTLVVPENRRDPASDLIALPVVRIRATGAPAEPIFHLAGGPGQTNLSFRHASRLTGGHDVVLVGYRGLDGSTVLDCPEVTDVLRHSADFAGAESGQRAAEAFRGCASRLTGGGVDLAGYSLPQRVDDLEAARVALGYGPIDLLSQSAGTRTAMIYAWRYPDSLHSSVMIGVNPPGHYLWDPRITDEQLGHYSRLCARDAGCAARTPDLAASLRATAADLPDRWGPLTIKDGHVRAVSLFGLFHAASGAPLNAPNTLDAHLSAADGDAAGLWAMSTLADLVLPESFIWGEAAATVITDGPVVDGYYAAGGDPGSTLGNAASDFLWSGGRLTGVWPSGPDQADYRQPRPSAVPTLLIGGNVDFSTPPETAAADLLPVLAGGRQVVLTELGHTGDFWSYQPAAGDRLIEAFLDGGEVDTSGYRHREMSFQPGPVSFSTIAWVLVGVLGGMVVLALLLLGRLLRRRRPRGVLLRIVAPLVLGLGAWSAALLGTAILWPTGYVGDPVLAVLAVGPAAGVGVHLARSRPGVGALVATVAVALPGAWFAAEVAGLLAVPVGAVAGANLAGLLLDGRRPAPGVEIAPAGYARR
jgi:pimeloyl-ACP methyl ester carboxylesterase